MEEERGRKGGIFLGLCLAARVMGMVGVNIMVVQETKIGDPTFSTHSFKGFSILAAAVDSNQREERHLW